jgi:hypothetical protein
MIFANQLASHVRTFLIQQPLPAVAFVAAVITAPSQKPSRVLTAFVSLRQPR